MRAPIALHSHRKHSHARSTTMAKRPGNVSHGVLAIAWIQTPHHPRPALAQEACSSATNPRGPWRDPVARLNPTRPDLTRPDPRQASGVGAVARRRQTNCARRRSGKVSAMVMMHRRAARGKAGDASGGRRSERTPAGRDGVALRCTSGSGDGDTNAMVSVVGLLSARCCFCRRLCSAALPLLPCPRALPYDGPPRSPLNLSSGPLAATTPVTARPRLRLSPPQHPVAPMDDDVCMHGRPPEDRPWTSIPIKDQRWRSPIQIGRSRFAEPTSVRGQEVTWMRLALPFHFDAPSACVSPPCFT
jgi:hypothetical protein